MEDRRAENQGRRDRRGLIHLLAALFALAWIVTPVRGVEAAPELSRLSPSPPCAELVAAAQARQIPLAGIDPPRESGGLRDGDSFSMLATLFEGGQARSHWLFHVTASPSTAGKSARKARSPMVIYSGAGRKLEYASCPTWVSLRTLGPFNAAGPGKKLEKARDRQTAFALDEGFLGLGLDRAAATLYRAGQAKARGGFWYGSNPPNAAQAAEARKFAESLQLKPEEDRALGGMSPALLSYGDVVQHTEDLQEVLMRVLEKPSIWSVIGHLGIQANLLVEARRVGPADVSSWGFPDSVSAYRLPMRFELNGQLALTLTLLVASPRPPLLACGGIIGMVAEKPGDPETYLTLRVVSARTAKTR